MTSPELPITPFTKPHDSEASESFFYADASERQAANVGHELLKFMLRSTRAVTIDPTIDMNNALSELDEIVARYDQVAPRRKNTI